MASRGRAWIPLALTGCGVGAVVWTAYAMQRPQNQVVRVQSVGVRQGVARPGGAARNPAEDAAPGQLTILNKAGKPAGLCPLQHTDVRAEITGYVARVTVEQKFRNPTQTPIEAVYTFPLPGDAAVDDMTMTLGKRVIRAQIKEREEAREIYETAKAQGQATALLDQERPNIFTQAVANILPGEQVTITIRYLHLLQYEEGEYSFHFPMVVGPRYIGNGGGHTEPGKRGEPTPKAAKEPSEDPIKADVQDADKITPPITPPGTRAGHNISLRVALETGMPVQNVRSTLHPIAVEPQGIGKCRVTLKDEVTIPNKDFILKFRVGGDQIQSALLTHAPNGSKGGYFTLILQPPNAPMMGQITPKEMVFVIDQTGSQGGWPIAKAKETMRYCIQNLNPGDTFQLIGFNTSVFPCFEKPVPATPETVAQALKYLEPLEGSGGTDILKSVDYALQLPDDPNRLRIVCYMTDGYVGNDMQILDHIQKNRGRARMFPFGVGNSVNRFLIDGMATEGAGAAEYVSLQDDGKTAAQKFYRRIARPLLMDIGVEWNGLPVADVFPRAIPDLFTAGPIILKGRYTQPGTGVLTLRGRLRGQPWQVRVPVTFPERDTDGSAIATLWARERIEDLQRQDWIGAQNGKPNPGIKKQLIATALEYRLMSQYTSFVAVEERIINAGGQTRKIDVPVEMPEGVSYEGIFGKEALNGESLGRQLGQFGANFFVGVRTDRSRYGFSRGGSSGSPYGSGGNSGGPGGPLGPQGPPGPAGSTNLGGGNAANAKQRGAPAKPGEMSDELADMEAAPAGPETKMHRLLWKLAARVAKEGRNGSLSVPGKLVVKDGKVEIQIAFRSLPKDGLDKLKALGFTLTTTLTPDRLVLGWLPVAKLEKVAVLDFVTRLAPPSYR